jgi:hypothetical protein
MTRPFVMRVASAWRRSAPMLLALACCASPASAHDLIVKYDQSQLLRLPRPVSEIIIGNPSIAEVTVQSSDMLVVTGKSFGMTNIILLDSERKVMQEQRVLVIRDEIKTVNLHKGSKRESYNCTPQCNPSLVVGDDNSYFEAVAKTAERKIKFSGGAAEETNSGNTQ